MVQGDPWQDGLPGGSDSGERIGCLVVGMGDVMEFASVEGGAELLDVEPVEGHVCISGVPFPRHLLHHQVRITEAQDPVDTDLLGQPEPVRQCLVFGYVVGGLEVDLQRVLQPVSLGRGEHDAGSQAPEYLRPIEVHPLVVRIRNRWEILGLGPVDEEVRHRL